MEDACKAAGRQWVEGAVESGTWNPRRITELRLYEVAQAYGIQSSPGLTQIQAAKEYLFGHSN